MIVKHNLTKPQSRIIPVTLAKFGNAYVINLVPSKNESLPFIVSIDNQLCSNDFVIANAFNDYFINSVINLNDTETHYSPLIKLA